MTRLQIALIFSAGPGGWERANVIVQALVTVDTGSSEGGVI